MPIDNDVKGGMIEYWRETLKASGFRVTQSRLAVLSCLHSSDEPLSPKDLYSKIQKNKKLEKIDQVTVYRILDTLLRIGLIHQVFPSGAYVICGHNRCEEKIHAMLRCTECKNFQEVDLPNSVFSPLEWFLENEFQFSPKHHLFQMDGVCHSCS